MFRRIEYHNGRWGARGRLVLRGDGNTKSLPRLGWRSMMRRAWALSGTVRGPVLVSVRVRVSPVTEQREPVVDPLSGQALVSTGPLLPSPAPRAQIEPGTEQVEKALSGALVDVEIGA